MHYDYPFAYKQQRIYMLRFENLRSAQRPALYYPEIDARGFYRPETLFRPPDLPKLDLGLDRGPVLGTTEGDIVFIGLRRVRISNDAPLFVTSSNENVMIVFPTRKPEQTLPNPIPNALEKEEVQPLAVKGVKGSGGVAPNVARIQVRYGSVKGPIVAEMTVYVFTRIDVFVAPHLVKVSGVPVASTFDINAIFKPIQAVWQPCGIRFIVRGPNTFDAKSNVDMPGKWSDDTPDGIFDRYYNAAGINIYFVPELADQTAINEAKKQGKDPKKVDHSANAFAYTLSLESAKGLKGNYVPLVISSTNSDAKTTSFAIAHELGHFLNLPHIDDPFKTHPPAPLDFWSLASLMRSAHQPKLVMPYYGHLIQMKDLIDKNAPTVNHITDPEWFTARKATKAVKY